MTLYGVEQGKVRIGVPTRFLRDWVSQNYAERIRMLWNGENESIANVEILVTGKTMAQPAESEAAPAVAAKDGVDAAAADEKDLSLIHI